MVDTDHVATKEDIARLEAKVDTGLSQVETRLTRWILSSSAVILAAVVALTKL